MKLLNFLLHVTPASESVVFTLPWGSYTLPPIQNQRFIVKLTDFGTAEIQAEGPLTVGQVGCFPRWSRSLRPLRTRPPSTCFPLRVAEVPQRIVGIWDCLCSTCFFRRLRMLVLHVSCRYEVVMAECICPPEFDKLVQSYWTQSTRSNAFGVLRHVLKDDDQNVLSTTLYRQLVLWFHPNLPNVLFDSNVCVLLPLLT